MKLITTATIAISVLYIIVDLSTRFSSAAHNANKAGTAADARNVISLPQLTNAQTQQLNQAYFKYQPDAEPEKIIEKVFGLNAEQQLAQAGDLTEFYAGDLRYRLLAIIFPDGNKQALEQPMALLRVRNVNDVVTKSKSKSKSKDTKPKSIEKISHGSTLAKFNVSITSTKQVDLQLNERKISLLMYQPAKAKNKST
jgi:hypothetical protein